ncbi:MAG: hypothetical protein EOP09_04450 [Proteobacteria bacterium]|nr:MAG: hypothetical protein EOP09_04450 [Pseudomonadota bacterium]
MGRFIFALVISLVSLNDVDASPGCDLIPGSDEGWLFQLFEEYGHPMYREFTHIEDGQRQFPEIFFIDKDRVVRTQITNQGASDLAEITMKRGSRARPTDLQKVDPDALSDDQAFNLWFRSEKEPGLGQYAQMVKQGLMADPSAVAEAKRYAISKGHRIQNSMTGDIHLSNQGAQSYFEFIPEGRTDSVHARVLNIYTDHEHVDDYFSRRNPPEVANILVEFIGQKQIGSNHCQYAYRKGN